MFSQETARVWLSVAIWLSAMLLPVRELPLSAQEPTVVPMSHGCVRTTEATPEPETTDLDGGITYYGFVRQCTDGRPAILTIDLVDYYEGEEAIREASKDGKILERDVDPVVYVRNRNPKLRRLSVKPEADVLMFDCLLLGCASKRVHLDELPWNTLYRFRLQNGLIAYIELPYSP